MSPRLRLWLQARERRMEGGPLPLSAVAARRRVTDALWSRLSARSGAVARFSLGTLVGRGGLEPPTSALGTANAVLTRVEPRAIAAELCGALEAKTLKYWWWWTYTYTT